jgi:hypothetical protein
MLFAGTQASAISWQTQAERLQNVYASIFDTYPLSVPYRNKKTLSLSSTISLLPDINPRVGGKKENPPQPPIHSVPIIRYTHRLSDSNTHQFYGSLWGGMLPRGFESLVGIDASLQQWIAGTAIHYQYPLGQLLTGTTLLVPLGWQYTEARMQGSITEENTTDSFSVQNQIVYAAPGIAHQGTGTWINLLIAKKNTKSRLEIAADQTVFSFRDTLSDQDWPLATQISAGWEHSDTGLQLIASELWVPGRLLMPRFKLAYQTDL